MDSEEAACTVRGVHRSRNSPHDRFRILLYGSKPSVVLFRDYAAGAAAGHRIKPTPAVDSNPPARCLAHKSASARSVASQRLRMMWKRILDGTFDSESPRRTAGSKKCQLAAGSSDFVMPSPSASPEHEGRDGFRPVEEVRPQTWLPPDNPAHLVRLQQAEARRERVRRGRIWRDDGDVPVTAGS